MDDLTTGGTATAPYAGASQSAIKHHYDVGNEFWQLWLDPTMTYSCALWEEGDTLEAAQRRKLDYMIDGAGAAGAERVLDVGCGWGSMLRRAVERDAKQGIGVTLSEAQHEYISAQGNPAIDVTVTSWSDFDPGDPVDAIISVGAFEHFAKLGLSREQKVKDAYQPFFDRCRDWLAPGGRMSLQTICKGDVALDGRGLRDFAFIMRKIFPESDLPHPGDIVEAIERRFELISLRNDRDDYVRTCRAWLEQLQSHRDEALAVAGEDVYRAYELYLEACIRQFERNHAGLLRFVLQRVDDPGTPFRLGGGGDG